MEETILKKKTSQYLKTITWNEQCLRILICHWTGWLNEKGKSWSDLKSRDRCNNLKSSTWLTSTILIDFSWKILNCIFYNWNFMILYIVHLTISFKPLFSFTNKLESCFNSRITWYLKNRKLVSMHFKPFYRILKCLLRLNTFKCLIRLFNGKMFLLVGSICLKGIQCVSTFYKNE